MKKIYVFSFILIFLYSYLYAENSSVSNISIQPEPKDSTFCEQVTDTVPICFLNEVEIPYKETMQRWEKDDILCSYILDPTYTIFHYGEKARYGIYLCIPNSKSTEE